MEKTKKTQERQVKNDLEAAEVVSRLVIVANPDDQS